MRKRPWPIVLLASLHFLAPVWNLSFYSSLTNLGIVAYLKAALSQATPFELLNMTILFPLAAISIYAAKKWSYWVYLLAMGTASVGAITTWSEAQGTFPLTTLILGMLINLLVVIYFMIPNVRRMYFDKSVRWWENAPRYKVSATVHAKDNSEIGQILNLSEGGLFMRSPKSFSEGDQIEITFAPTGQKISSPSKIVHRKMMADGVGYGIQFTAMSDDQSKILRAVMKELKAKGATNARDDGLKGYRDFVRWIRAATKGQELVPEYQRTEQKK